MKRLLVLLLLLTAPAAFAARATTGSQPFPNDFKAHPCAPSDACASLTQSEIGAAASTLRGFSLRQDWVDKHWNEMMELMRPTCRKLATCYATPGNGSVFCMDLLYPEFWGICDRYAEDSDDNQQCAYFTRIYTLRADLRDKKIWKEAQSCSSAVARDGEPRKMDVWMTPKVIDATYGGRFVVYALDPETHVPIQALVEMQDTPLSARAPGGKPWTNYDLEWPVTFRRVPRADGHTDLVPPTITVTAGGYIPVTMTMPATPGTVTVEMSPSPDKLKPGKNLVTVTAKDSLTGKPVEMRVLAGADTILGYTNQPFALELKKGTKRPEIWATSLFNRYLDIVIAPAEK